jgi:hypothetical protein
LSSARDPTPSSARSRPTLPTPSARRVTQTFMTARREHLQTPFPMISGMRIMVPQPVHVLVPSLTIPNPTCERPNAFLQHEQVCLRHFHPIHGILDFARCTRRSRGSWSGRGQLWRTRGRRLCLLRRRCRFGRQEHLDGFHLLDRFQRAAPVCHVVLQPIGLLVAFVAVGFRAPKGLA